MMDGMKDNPKYNIAPTFSKWPNIAPTFSKRCYNDKAEDKVSCSKTQSSANPQAINLESSTLPILSQDGHKLIYPKLILPI